MLIVRFVGAADGARALNYSEGSSAQRADHGGVSGRGRRTEHRGRVRVDGMLFEGGRADEHDLSLPTKIASFCGRIRRERCHGVHNGPKRSVGRKEAQRLNGFVAKAKRKVDTGMGFQVGGNECVAGLVCCYCKES